MNFENLSGADFAGLSVGRVIGKSASGVTYLAEADGAPFALKVLPPRLTEAANEAAAQFRRELDLASGLTHDNLVKILRTGEEEGLTYAVLEFIEAPSLADLLRDHAPLPIDWHGDTGCKFTVTGSDTCFSIDAEYLQVERLEHPRYIRHIKKE